MIFQINNDDLGEALSGSESKITILDFYADWCAPCRAYTPLIMKFADENTDVSVAKVNLEQNQGLAQQYGVRAIPTTVILKDGQLITKVSGVIQPTKLSEMISPLR